MRYRIACAIMATLLAATPTARTIIAHGTAAGDEPPDQSEHEESSQAQDWLFVTQTGGMQGSDGRIPTGQGGSGGGNLPTGQGGDGGGSSQSYPGSQWTSIAGASVGTPARAGICYIHVNDLHPGTSEFEYVDWEGGGTTVVTQTNANADGNFDPQTSNPNPPLGGNSNPRQGSAANPPQGGAANPPQGGRPSPSIGSGPTIGFSTIGGGSTGYRIDVEYVYLIDAAAPISVPTALFVAAIALVISITIFYRSHRMLSAIRTGTESEIKIRDERRSKKVPGKLNIIPMLRNVGQLTQSDLVIVLFAEGVLALALLGFLKVRFDLVPKACTPYFPDYLAYQLFFKSDQFSSFLVLMSIAPLLAATFNFMMFAALSSQLRHEKIMSPSPVPSYVGLVFSLFALLGSCATIYQAIGGPPVWAR